MTDKEKILNAVKRYETQMEARGKRPLSPTIVELSGITEISAVKIDEIIAELVAGGEVTTAPTLNSKLVRTRHAMEIEEQETCPMEAAS